MMQQIVPVSTQLFLFADKVVPLSSAFTAETLISYSQKKVKTNELAAYLLAFTLWNLFQKKFISLEIQPVKKMFFIPSGKLVVCIKKDIPVFGDLENWLIKGIERPNQDVKQLIHNLFDEDQAWPHKIIIHKVSKEACESGFGKIRLSGSDNSVLRGFTGNIDFEANSVIVSELEDEFDLIVQQWNQFLALSSKIAGMLITLCRSALNSRVIQND